MDFELLVNELKKLNSQIGSYAYYILGLKYAQELNDVNIAQLIKTAGLTESMSKEIGKAKKVAELIQSGKYGICFESSSDGNVVLIKNKKENDVQYSKEQIVKILADLYDSDIEKSAVGGIFIFKYGKHVVDKYTPTELMREAHLLNPNVKERYAAELNGAFLMYRYFQNNPTEFDASCGQNIQNIPELFATYLKNEGKSEATVDRYVKQVPQNGEVQNIVQSIAGTTVLFDVVDVAKLLEISQKVAAQDFDKKGGKMYSAGINAFAHFVSNLNLFQRHIEKGHENKQLVWPKHSVNLPPQTIFYGAPGTGKSYKVKSEKLAGVPEENIFRTTFHPDYDYASFVGCYKPTKEKTPLLEYSQLLNVFDTISEPHKLCKIGFLYWESFDKINKTQFLKDCGKETQSPELNAGIDMGKNFQQNNSSITYSFIPQVFTKAYIKAWEEMKQENPQPVYLVIEEINRGNCAQIFGDIFQLLDRNDAGFSTYPIVPDADITRELKTVFASLDLSSVENYINGIFSENYSGGIVDKIKSGELLVLPCNLNLLATMNTSDQSLFPMDSAFKRRWDWEFVPIRYSAAEAKDDKDNFHTFEIEIGDKKYKWTDFLEKVNAKILSVTDSEDKQMGEYFIKKSVDEKTFINKVMYYLWSEVGKDMYNTTNALFTLPEGNDKKEFSFNELFKGNTTDLLQGFMKKLEVKSEEEKE